MAPTRALVLLAVGLGLLAGALFEVTLGVKRDTKLCDKDGRNCGLHYSAPGFSILMVSGVVGIVGGVLLYHGVKRFGRDERQEEDDA